MEPAPPIRFFAVSYGRYDSYQEYFILATSPNDALKRFLRSHRIHFTEAGIVHEADLDPNGLLVKTRALYGIELLGEKGYLWDNEATRGLIRNSGRVCKLCGVSGTAIVNDVGKCQICADLRQIEK